MTKQPTPQIVTANHLLAGDVVYQTTLGWSRDLQDAEVLTDADHAEARLKDAQRQVDCVVGAYLTEITVTETGLEPAHFREDFRATGPSNYLHGKQAEGASHV